MFLALEISGRAWAGPFLGFSMTFVWAMGILFAVNVLMNLRGPSAVPAE